MQNVKCRKKKQQNAECQNFEFLNVEKDKISKEQNLKLFIPSEENHSSTKFLSPPNPLSLMNDSLSNLV